MATVFQILYAFPTGDEPVAKRLVGVPAIGPRPERCCLVVGSRAVSVGGVPAFPRARIRALDGPVLVTSDGELDGGSFAYFTPGAASIELQAGDELELDLGDASRAFPLGRAVFVLPNLGERVDLHVEAE
jgi:hypothetical protein